MYKTFVMVDEIRSKVSFFVVHWSEIKVRRLEDPKSKQWLTRGKRRKGFCRFWLPWLANRSLLFDRVPVPFVYVINSVKCLEFHLGSRRSNPSAMVNGFAGELRRATGTTNVYGEYQLFRPSNCRVAPLSPANVNKAEKVKRIGSNRLSPFPRSKSGRHENQFV